MGKKQEREIFLRLYSTIKADVISNYFLPGERINVDQLAERKRVSTTPVREVLCRLVGEGLVESRPQFGFCIQRLSESDLIDSYKLNQLILDQSLKDIGSIGWQLSSPLLQADVQHSVEIISRASAYAPTVVAESTALLFKGIVETSDNIQTCKIIERTNDMLYRVRVWEWALNAGSVPGLVQIADSFFQKDTDSLRLAISDYHQSRLDNVRSIVRNVHKPFSSIATEQNMGSKNVEVKNVEAKNEAASSIGNKSELIDSAGQKSSHNP